MTKAKYTKITITLRYIGFVPAKPDIKVVTKQKNQLFGFVRYLINNGKSEYGWHYKFNGEILVQRGVKNVSKTLIDYGIVDGSVIEVYSTASPKARIAGKGRQKIEGEDQLRAPKVTAFKVRERYSNYLVAPFFLDFSTKMTSVQRLEEVQYSGITEVQNPFNRVKTNVREFDLKKYGTIVLLHWDTNSARKLGFPSTELASVGFEFLICEMDEQFASTQYAGVRNSSINLMAYQLAKKIPGIRKMLKDMIIQALEDPIFLHSDEDIAKDEVLAEANEIIMLQAQDNVKLLIKYVYESPEAEAFKLHVEKALESWNCLIGITADVVSGVSNPPVQTNEKPPLKSIPVQTNVEPSLKSIPVQTNVEPSSSKAGASRKRTQKSATPDISEPPIKKPLISESSIEKRVEDLNKQGMNKYDDDEYEDAIELFLKAIGIEETGRNGSCWLGKFWNNVAICWSGLERPEKALKASKKAIEYDDSRSVHFYNRAIAYRDLGKYAEAKADFKKALEFDPIDDDAKAELAKLKKRKNS